MSDEFFNFGKLCSVCLAEKELSEFYKHPLTRDGRQSRCKVCTKAAATTRYNDNKKEILDSMRSKYAEAVKKGEFDV